MVASKTVISPIFFTILPRHVRERMGLVEFPRLLGLLRSWGLNKREAGERARYVAVTISDQQLTIPKYKLNEFRKFLGLKR